MSHARSTPPNRYEIASGNPLVGHALLWISLGTRPQMVDHWTSGPFDVNGLSHLRSLEVFAKGAGLTLAGRIPARSLWRLCCTLCLSGPIDSRSAAFFPRESSAHIRPPCNPRFSLDSI